MVTQQILVLFFQVRILVVQHEAFLMEREAFFMRGGWFRDDVQTAFFPSQGFCKKIFHLSGYIVSLLKQVYCVQGCTGHLSAEAFPFFMEDGKRPSLKGLFFLRQTIFQSQASDFSFCAKWFSAFSRSVFRSHPDGRLKDGCPILQLFYMLGHSVLSFSLKDETIFLKTLGGGNAEAEAMFF